ASARRSSSAPSSPARPRAGPASPMRPASRSIERDPIAMIATRCALAMLAIVSLATAASAQSARPLKMIVPFPPGGPVDVAAPIVSERLPRVLGQPVIVENRAGAAGALGAKQVANAEPDGSTLLFGNISTLVVVPVVTGQRDYDPAKAFVPVAKVSLNHEVL